MAEFGIKTNQIKRSANSESNICCKMKELSEQIRSVSGKIRLDGSSERVIRSNLNVLAQNNADNAVKMMVLSSTLNSIAAQYDSTERCIINGKNATVEATVIGVKNAFYYILRDKWKLEGSLISREITKKGTILGFNSSGTAEGEMIGGYVKTKSKTSWKPKDGDAKIEKSIEAEGHVAKGKLKGNIGLLGGEIGATIGTVGATGKIGATLFKDGKFSPVLEAKAKAEAAAAKGSAEGKIGNDNYNAHVKGSGTLFGAEAEASGSVGKITYKDANGKTKTEYGAKGKVGAEAYAAQGKVSGGFTLFGIKVDAGISGKAGGAGVSAEGQITTGGVSGKIGAGLGLGAGLEISIDWSNFSLW